MRRAAAVAAVAAVALVAAGCGGGKGKGYTFTLPSGWLPVESPPAGVIAAYQRKDRAALVTIRKDRRVPVISRRFIRGLDRQFRKSLKGYVPLTDRILITDAGPVFFFAYTQKTTRQLTSIVLVPAHGYSYVLDVVSNPTVKPARRDIATIIHTFKPTG